MIAVVHAETSTGVRNEIEPLGRGKGDALLLVDMVTSLGGIEVAVDAWAVDIAYSGTQKCLGVPPGLAPLTVSERALDRMVERPTSWYLDLNLLARYVNDAAGQGSGLPPHGARLHGRRPPRRARAPCSTRGSRPPAARHAECGRLLQDGLTVLGLDLLVAAPHRLPQLTTVRVPDGVDEAAVRHALLGTYGIEIGAGAGRLAGRIWRIGCMGHTARRRNVLALLGALGEVLGR